MFLKFVLFVLLANTLFLFADQGNFNPDDCLDDCAIFRLEKEFHKIKEEHTQLQQIIAVQKMKINSLELGINSQLNFYQENTILNKTIHSETLDTLLYIISIIGSIFGLLFLFINFKWVDSKIESVVLRKTSPLMEKLVEKKDELDRSFDDIENLQSALKEITSKYEDILSDYSSKLDDISHKPFATYTPEDKATLDRLAKEISTKKDKNDSDLFFIGTDILNKGEYKTALTYFEKAIELNPTQPEYYMNMAISYYRLGELDQAISIYKKVIELYPNYSLAYTNIAAPLIDNCEYQKALDYSLKAVEMLPQLSNAYLNLFEARLLNQQNFDEKLLADFYARCNPNQTDKNIVNMLQVFQLILSDKPLNADLIAWKETLEHGSFAQWSFLGLERFIERNSFSPQIKDRLLSQIEEFKKF